MLNCTHNLLLLCSKNLQIEFNVHTIHTMFLKKKVKNIGQIRIIAIFTEI
jgi:hypothetical protein